MSIDHAIRCDACDAACCRLTVILQPGDAVPAHFTTLDAGQRVMDRDEDGWCVAIDSARMCCSIYETRPAVCRRFPMGGPDCRDIRADLARQNAREIPLTLS